MRTLLVTFFVLALVACGGRSSSEPPVVAEEDASLPTTDASAPDAAPPNECDRCWLEGDECIWHMRDDAGWSDGTYSDGTFDCDPSCCR